MPREQSKDIAHGALGWDGIWEAVIEHGIDEFLFGVKPDGNSVRLPPIIVNSANNGWQLCAKIDGFFHS